MTNWHNIVGFCSFKETLEKALCYFSSGLKE